MLAESSLPHLERSAISDAIHQSFGISIPTLVVRNLLRLMRKQGLTENIGNEVVRITDKGMASAPALQQQVIQYNQRQTELVSSFEKFVNERFPEQAGQLLAAPSTTLASYFELHAAPLLNQALRGQSSSRAPNPGADFIIASFVTYLSSNDQSRFGYVVEAAKGAMLSAVLLLDTSSLSNSLRDLTLVLDTPVLMDALGFHGKLAQAATAQLISLALDQAAEVTTFDHSVSELNGVLEHVSQALRNGSRSRSTSLGYLHFVDIGATPADIALLQGRLDARLNEARIQVVSRPDGYYQYGLDEGRLEDIIQSKVHYFQDAARVNDVVSLSSTHRLRKGRRSKELEHCRAILVTSNTGLVSGAIEFEKASSNFPLAITTDAAASVLWVRSPATAPDAPREMLLAAAYAGMQPTAAVWTKYLEEIETLESNETVSADEALILRTSRTSRQSLMEESLGQTEAITSESPLAALDRIRMEATAPFEKQIRELKERTTEAVAVADGASAAWLEHLEARTSAEKELNTVKSSEAALAAEISMIRSDEQSKLINIRARSKAVAHQWRWAILVTVRCLSILLILGAVILFLALPDPAGHTGALIVGLVGFASLLIPLIPRRLRYADTLESALARWIERRRLVSLGYDPAREMN
nr:hypothetical protein [Microbacterium fandaimingii]